MDKLRLTSKHILLLLLYSPGKTENINEPISGRTRIIKMIFLFKEEIKREFLKDKNIDELKLPEFIAWNYGPFSKDIYDDIEFFINNRYIENSPAESEITEYEFKEYEDWIEDFAFEDDFEHEKELLLNSMNQEDFCLTVGGVRFVENRLYNYLSDNQKAILKAFKNKINGASLRAILRYTYINYPDYTKKSIIRDEIFG